MKKNCSIILIGTVKTCIYEANFLDFNQCCTVQELISGKWPLEIYFAVTSFCYNKSEKLSDSPIS